MPILRKLRHEMAKSPARTPLVWLRHQSLRANDVFLASYPRSGSTWLRFTLYEILSGEPSSFDKVNAALRGISDYKYGAGLLPNNGRFIGTHESYRPAYRRAVYLVRDVRDVALSEYAFETNLGIAPKSMDDYLEDLFMGRKRHGSWQHHVESWIDSPLAANGNLLFIRYEDLRKDSVEIFRQMVDFLGVKVSNDTIERAVANNTVQKMREKEDSLYKQDSYSAVPRRPQKGVGAGGRFIRSGSIGGWQGRLTPEQLNLIEKYTGPILLRLGYPMSTATETELAQTV